MTNDTITVLSQLLKDLPVGTNLALLHFMWMLVTGALLPNRGAMFPALKATGLSDQATRRAWRAFRKGAWQIGTLLGLWQINVMGMEGWQLHRFEGYSPVPVDVTAFSRRTSGRCGDRR